KLDEQRGHRAQANDPAKQAADFRSEPFEEQYWHQNKAVLQRVKHDRPYQSIAKAWRTGLIQPADAETEQPFPRSRAQHTISDDKINEYYEDREPVDAEVFQLLFTRACPPDCQESDWCEKEFQGDAVQDVRADQRPRAGRVLAAGEQVDERLAEVIERLPASVA